MPEEHYRALLDAIDTTMEDLNDKIYEREDDYTDEDREAMLDKHRTLDELGDWLKVETGHAYRFDRHFNVVLNQDGDAIEARYPAGEELDPNTLHHVWTVLDCDGKLCISPGYHWVNRVSHIMTKEQWTDEDELKEWIY
jgi:hypothetical protein